MSVEQENAATYYVDGERNRYELHLDYSTTNTRRVPGYIDRVATITTYGFQVTLDYFDTDVNMPTYSGADMAELSEISVGSNQPVYAARRNGDTGAYYIYQYSVVSSGGSGAIAQKWSFTGFVTTEDTGTLAKLDPGMTAAQLTLLDLVKGTLASGLDQEEDAAAAEVPAGWRLVELAQANDLYYKDNGYVLRKDDGAWSAGEYALIYQSTGTASDPAYTFTGWRCKIADASAGVSLGRLERVPDDEVSAHVLTARTGLSSTGAQRELGSDGYLYETGADGYWHYTGKRHASSVDGTVNVTEADLSTRLSGTDVLSHYTVTTVDGRVVDGAIAAAQMTPNPISRSNALAALYPVDDSNRFTSKDGFVYELVTTSVGILLGVRLTYTGIRKEIAAAGMYEDIAPISGNFWRDWLTTYGNYSGWSSSGRLFEVDRDANGAFVVKDLGTDGNGNEEALRALYDITAGGHYIDQTGNVYTLSAPDPDSMNVWHLKHRGEQVAGMPISGVEAIELLYRGEWKDGAYTNYDETSGVYNVFGAGDLYRLAGNNLLYIGTPELPDGKADIRAASPLYPG